MADQSNEDQRILDARMEYGYLHATVLSLANMFWTGYRAFFTMNTLLGTGLALSYSIAVRGFNKDFLWAVHLLFPVMGLFISITAIRIAVQMTNVQRVAIMRGRELEDVLFSRIFKDTRARLARFPAKTTIGCLLFGTVWGCALYAALWP